MKKVEWKCRGFLGYKNSKPANSGFTFADIIELINMIDPKYRVNKTVKWPKKVKSGDFDLILKGKSNKFNNLTWDRINESR